MEKEFDFTFMEVLQSFTYSSQIKKKDIVDYAKEHNMPLNSKDDYVAVFYEMESEEHFDIDKLHYNKHDDGNPTFWNNDGEEIETKD